MSGGSSIYTPLPQSNTDSDDEFSEEELHTFNGSRRVFSKLGKHRKQPGQGIILNNKNPDLINHKHWDSGNELSITLGGFQIGSDEVPAFTTNKNTDSLSPARKICFIFSIFLCVFVTVVFLWVIPCETNTCPHDSVIPLKQTLSHIELFGPVSIVPGVGKDKVENLIFLFRKSLTGERVAIRRRKHSGENGVVSVLAGCREASWRIFLEQEPNDVDCNVIDLNQDGVNDCLVVGKDKLLMAVESSSGKRLWNFTGAEGYNKLERCSFEFPLVLPDLDGDDVGDLLSVCGVDDEGGFDAAPHHYSKNYFVLVSGKRGGKIGEPAEIRNCSSIVDVTLEKEYVISYRCLNWTSGGSVNSVALRDLFSNANGSTLDKLNTNKTYSEIIQHKINPDGNVLYLDGRRFSLDNRGQCPGKCGMSVAIEDERSGKSNETVWAMRIHNSYGMIPVGLKCEKFLGFVFKYWHWVTEEKGEVEFSEEGNGSRELDEEAGTNMSMIPNSMRLEEPMSLEYAMFGGDMPEYERYKRTVAKKLPEGEVENEERNIVKQGNLTFHKIVERIILITFNDSNMNVTIPSESDIVQICGSRGNCQPDARFQRHSLHIADVDNDNFKELISYSSSFNNEPDEGSSSLDDGLWLLQSDVEVIKLERELSKMYDDKN